MAVCLLHCEGKPYMRRRLFSMLAAVAVACASVGAAVGGGGAQASASGAGTGAGAMAGAVTGTGSVAAAETYDWKNVRIDGGGFVPGIVFNQTEKNLVYARTD